MTRICNEQLYDCNCELAIKDAFEGLDELIFKFYSTKASANSIPASDGSRFQFVLLIIF